MPLQSVPCIPLEKTLSRIIISKPNFPRNPIIYGTIKRLDKLYNREKSWLNRKNEEKRVAIYKIEDKTTHQCYIGQTIDPDRRKEEHFNHSSNRRLREAIQQKGKKVFDFSYEWVTGIEADREETYRINSYRKRAVVNLNKKHQQDRQRKF